MAKPKGKGRTNTKVVVAKNGPDHATRHYCESDKCARGHELIMHRELQPVRVSVNSKSRMAFFHKGCL